MASMAPDEDQHDDLAYGEWGLTVRRMEARETWPQWCMQLVHLMGAGDSRALLHDLSCHQSGMESIQITSTGSSNANSPWHEILTGMQPPTGPLPTYVRNEPILKEGATPKNTTEKPWDILRMAIIWCIWCQKCGYDLRGEEFTWR
jgi:hypothetical protein